MRIRSTLLALVSFAAVGCAKATVVGFRDPSFAFTRFSRLAVIAGGMTLENAVAVERATCQRLAPAPCTVGKEALPPTRSYSMEEAKDLLTLRGVDGVLVILLTSDEESVRYLGTTSSTTAQASVSTMGTVNLYRSGGILSSQSTTSLSARTRTEAEYSYSRAASAQLGIFDRATGRLAWRGEINVSGVGAFASDGQFIQAATKEIAAELKRAGLSQ